MTAAAPIAKDQLLARLAGGAFSNQAAHITVVTPNTRLAQALAREFDDAQAAAGKTSWETADILPLSSWLTRAHEDALYSPLASKLPLMLSAAQEQALWEEAIRSSKLAETLLSAAATAAQCRDAWQVAHAWRLQGSIAGYPANDDARAYLEWSAQYAAATARFRQTDNARLPDVLMPLLPDAAIRKPALFVLYGFDIVTAQQRGLLDALSAIGVEIKTCAPALRAAKLARIALNAARDEMRAAASWARARLEANPKARIAIVVPKLAQERARVRRAFAAVMRPDYIVSGATPTPMPFNISLGVGLDTFPLAHDALRLLELCGRDVAFADASRLLRSPFLGGAESELAARARLDAHWRERVAPRVNIDELSRLAALRNAPQAPGMALLLTKLAELRKTQFNGRKPASEWARLMSEALSQAGFPGERSLDSTEYQTLKKWHELLAGFAALDRVQGGINYADALARLRRMAADTLFQPEAFDEPIQVLGVLESAGLAFDHLWVMGLTDEAWPLPARPNPFVPVKLQRAAGVPEADATSSLELDRRITAGWLGSAAEVVLSHAEREDDRELSPSPLILDVPVMAITELALPERADFSQVIHTARAEERHDDHIAPALNDAGLHSGGTGLFRDQAACAFRAFAAHRLGAGGLETPEPGLSAMDRGSLLHSVLAAAWAALSSHMQLDAMPLADLDVLLARCADEAIAQLRRRKPDALAGRFAELEAARLANLAREWILFEKARPDFAVVAVEQKRAVSFGGVSVNARLDRMDRLADGGHVVIDYKTGSASVSAWLGARPDEPQLPLYALSSPEDIAAVAFAAVRKGEPEFKGVSRDPDLVPGVKPIAEQRSPLAKAYGSWDALLESWRREMEALGASFAAGEASVNPKRGSLTCTYCGMQPLCRINERSGEMADGEGEEG